MIQNHKSKNWEIRVLHSEIFSALLASGKTVEEVMTYLKSGNEEKVE